jgi:hypothetical protein
MDKSNLYDLLIKGTHIEIKENLEKTLYKLGDYCSEVIGRGFFGRVSIPAIGKYYSVIINGNTHNLPVVIKESNHVNANFTIDESNGNLMLIGNLSLSTEALMLFLLSKHWYKGLNLHLPFMIAFGNCNSVKIGIVTHIINERYGLKNIIEYDTKEYSAPYFQIINYRKKTTYLSTSANLVNYILDNMDEHYNCEVKFDVDSVTTINLIDYCDTFAIFYLHTSHYLWEHFKFTLTDQHTSNIFIQWLYDYSICGDKSLTNINNIYYQLENKKYIKKSIGKFLFKIGDIGICYANIQDNVYIVGDYANGDKTFLQNKIEIFKNKIYTYMDTFDSLFSIIPIHILNKTKIYKYILNNEIFANFIPYSGYDLQKYNLIPSEMDILTTVYADLIVDHGVSDKNNFCVNIN